MDECTLPLGDFGPIPNELGSDYANAPFEECSVCGGRLSDGLYEIQKVSNKRETVLEMAICADCSMSMATEYSDQSLEAIRSFLALQLDLSRPPERCNICGDSLAVSRGRTVWGVCSGHRLLLPMIRVCHSCEEAIQALMSEKTRRSHNDFVNRTFPGVPADLDLAPTLFI